MNTQAKGREKGKGTDITRELSRLPPHDRGAGLLWQKGKIGG